MATSPDDKSNSDSPCKPNGRFISRSTKRTGSGSPAPVGHAVTRFPASDPSKVEVFPTGGASGGREGRLVLGDASKVCSVPPPPTRRCCCIAASHGITLHAPPNGHFAALCRLLGPFGKPIVDPPSGWACEVWAMSNSRTPLAVWQEAAAHHAVASAPRTTCVRLGGRQAGSRWWVLAPVSAH